ncbi:hypothetical protein JTE90_028696 [Oedothorax gibbosus]|uniref:Phospholipase A2 n=1 Tax=Oedothorax gibbosus TaxID=931172 RepID=A0AAV6U0T9_9ARAC|nr:hypothetical protein JTE90_028696 [Oedothorax gibbosus]
MFRYVVMTLMGLTVVCDGKYATIRNHTSADDDRWYFYVDADGERMVSAVADKYGQFQDCYVSGDSSLIKMVVQSVPVSNVTLVDPKTMDQITEDCAFAQANGLFEGQNGEKVWQQLGIFSGFFIYPGTKWCGAGNVSKEYEDLGSESDTDSCCREHDHCEDNIEGYDSKYGLRNNSPFTKSHCKCDLEFYQCLEKVDSRVSHRVGRMYFNFLQMECFRKDHPAVGCRKYRGWFRRRCLEYVHDYEQDPEWQFFDAQHYDASSEDDDDEENEIEEKSKKGDVFEYMIRLDSEEEHRYRDGLFEKTQ